MSPLPIDQVLLLSGIDGFVEDGATVANKPPHIEKPFLGTKSEKVAAELLYNAQYKQPASGYGTIDAVVTISESPTSEWAEYRLEHGANLCGIYQESARVDRFGSAVFMFPDSGGEHQCVYWRHDRKVLTVQYSGQRADEIVKAYLAKYPSSL